MALADIIKEIEKEKEKRIEEIKREKEKEIFQLKEKYTQIIEERKKEILERERERLKKEIEAEEEELKRKKEILVLEEKQKLLQKVFQMAFDEIKKMPRETERKITKILLEKILKEIALLNVKRVEIFPVCHKEEMIKDILKEMGKNYSLSSRCIPGEGGFVLKTEKFDVNCLFKTLFERVKEKSKIKVAKILF